MTSRLWQSIPLRQLYTMTSATCVRCRLAISRSIRTCYVREQAWQSRERLLRFHITPLPACFCYVTTMMDPSALLDMEKRTGISNDDIDGFLRKVNDVDSMIKGMKDGTMDPDDKRIRRKLGIKLPEEIKAEKDAFEKREKERLIRRTIDDRHVKEEEHRKWWNHAEMMHGEDDGNLTPEEREKKAEESVNRIVSCYTKRDANDYSQWKDWTPKDPVTLQEQAEQEKMMQKIKDAEFEKQNSDFCDNFKADMDDRKKKQDDKKKKADMEQKLGNGYFKRKDFRQAKGHYMTALGLDAFRIPLLTNIAQTHLRNEDYDQAIEFCKRALYVDKNAVKAYSRRAKAYRALGKLELAQADLDMAVTVAPHNEDLLKERKDFMEMLVENELEEEVARKLRVATEKAGGVAALVGVDKKKKSKKIDAGEEEGKENSKNSPNKGDSSSSSNNSNKSSTSTGTNNNSGMIEDSLIASNANAAATTTTTTTTTDVASRGEELRQQLDRMKGMSESELSEQGDSFMLVMMQKLVEQLEVQQKDVEYTEKYGHLVAQEEQNSESDSSSSDEESDEEEEEDDDDGGNRIQIQEVDDDEDDDDEDEEEEEEESSNGGGIKIAIEDDDDDSSDGDNDDEEEKDGSGNTPLLYPGNTFEKSATTTAATPPVPPTATTTTTTTTTAKAAKAAAKQQKKQQKQQQRGGSGNGNGVCLPMAVKELMNNDSSSDGKLKVLLRTSGGLSALLKRLQWGNRSKQSDAHTPLDPHLVDTLDALCEAASDDSRNRKIVVREGGVNTALKLLVEPPSEWQLMKLGRAINRSEKAKFKAMQNVNMNMDANANNMSGGIPGMGALIEAAAGGAAGGGGGGGGDFSLRQKVQINGLLNPKAKHLNGQTAVVKSRCEGSEGRWRVQLLGQEGNKTYNVKGRNLTSLGGGSSGGSIAASAANKKWRSRPVDAREVQLKLLLGAVRLLQACTPVKNESGSGNDDFAVTKLVKRPEQITALLALLCATDTDPPPNEHEHEHEHETTDEDKAYYKEASINRTELHLNIMAAAAGVVKCVAGHSNGKVALREADPEVVVSLGAAISNLTQGGSRTGGEHGRGGRCGAACVEAVEECVMALTNCTVDKELRGRMGKAVVHRNTSKSNRKSKSKSEEKQDSSSREEVSLVTLLCDLLRAQCREGSIASSNCRSFLLAALLNSCLEPTGAVRQAVARSGVHSLLLTIAVPGGSRPRHTSAVGAVRAAGLLSRCAGEGEVKAFVCKKSTFVHVVRALSADSSGVATTNAAAKAKAATTTTKKGNKKSSKKTKTKKGNNATTTTTTTTTAPSPEVIQLDEHLVRLIAIAVDDSTLIPVLQKEGGLDKLLACLPPPSFEECAVGDTATAARIRAAREHADARSNCIGNATRTLIQCLNAPHFEHTVEEGFLKVQGVERVITLLRDSKDGPVRKNAAICLAKMTKHPRAMEMIKALRGLEMLRELGNGMSKKGEI